MKKNEVDATAWSAIDVCKDRSLNLSPEEPELIRRLAPAGMSKEELDQFVEQVQERVRYIKLHWSRQAYQMTVSHVAASAEALER